MSRGRCQGWARTWAAGACALEPPLSSRASAGTVCPPSPSSEVSARGQRAWCMRTAVYNTLPTCDVARGQGLSVTVHGHDGHHSSDTELVACVVRVPVQPLAWGLDMELLIHAGLHLCCHACLCLQQLAEDHNHTLAHIILSPVTAGAFARQPRHANALRAAWGWRRAVARFTFASLAVHLDLGLHDYVIPLWLASSCQHQARNSLSSCKPHIHISVHIRMHCSTPCPIPTRLTAHAFCHAGRCIMQPTARCASRPSRGTVGRLGRAAGYSWGILEGTDSRKPTSLAAPMRALLAVCNTSTCCDLLARCGLCTRGAMAQPLLP